MPDDTPPIAITENRYDALNAKLRELFELDKADLDFGIYRIIAAKNREVTEFLDRQLRGVVRTTLAEHGAGATGQVEAELTTAIEQGRALGADPETLPRVRELRARLQNAGGAAAGELEADIYNHLLAFFSRYYDEGDFISQRRYKGDTYVIPYSGEEVTLHWANKDQYYIKSGEWHTDYRFRLPAWADERGAAATVVAGGGVRTSGPMVRFKLVEATQEAGNNKEAENSKRRYILSDAEPVEETEHELVLRFEFRVPTQAERDRAADGAVAIFGGDYAKASNPKKGDEREQFCADAERRAMPAMSAEWSGRVGRVIAAGEPDATATGDKPQRTLLGKHLNHFTARNTFDYFIHKDLGGFLRRELDFYIKNEVVRLDDLERLPPDHLQRVQGRIKAVRTVATRIIDFLAAIENFQKRMWLKKKFVLDTNWLVTVDRVPPELRDVVAANEEQWAEWERLGFGQELPEGEELFPGSAWRTRDYLDACTGLVADTRYLPVRDRASLLAYMAGPSDATNAALDISGQVIAGDSFHGLNLLQAQFSGTIKHTYIDPPYNAKYSEVLYKNSFKHSAWLAMMHARLQAARCLARPDGVLTIAIDENEQENLGRMLAMMYPAFERACISVVHNHGGIQGSNFSYCHEYAYFVFPSGSNSIGTLDRDEADIVPFRDWGGDTSRRESAKSCFYPIFVRGDQVIGFGDVCKHEFHPPAAVVVHSDGVLAIYPIDSEGNERKWRFARDTVESIKEELKCDLVGGEPTIRRRKSKYRFKTVWSDNRYNANSHGSRVLAELMGGPSFAFPKSIHTVADSIHATTQAEADSLILDFFAGSGTTGHAAIELQRGAAARKRFVLMEVGGHVWSVLIPRIAKVLYSPDWKDGKAQSHDRGVSALVKYFALESYEDALNNLPAPSESLLDGLGDDEKDALITYALDLELGPHLVNIDFFRDPWRASINAQVAGDPEIRPHRVDLVETFNYLIGLIVHSYGPLERYSATFERAAHDDDLGRVKVVGRLRRDPDGPFVFQRVEGELNPASNGGTASRVLVIWRTLTDDAEQDAAVLDAWMARYQQDTRERSAFRDHHLIYINGPVTLPQPTAEIRTVLPIEETFKARMFDETDGGGG